MKERNKERPEFGPERGPRAWPRGLFGAHVGVMLHAVAMEASQKHIDLKLELLRFRDIQHHRS